jgi:hypothetical protein
MTTLDAVCHELKTLKLGVMAANLEAVLQEAGRRNRDALAVIKLLVEMEREERWKNSISRRFSQSKLTEQVSIDQFDFQHHKSRQEQKSKILGS